MHTLAGHERLERSPRGLEARLYGFAGILFLGIRLHHAIIDCLGGGYILSTHLELMLT